MRSIFALAAVAVAVPATAAPGPVASTQMYSSYEECEAMLAWQMTIDQGMSDLECVQHGRSWMIIFDKRYSRNDRG